MDGLDSEQFRKWPIAKVECPAYIKGPFLESFSGTSTLTLGRPL